MADAGATAREQRLRTLVEDALTPLHLVVEDLSLTPAGKRRLVRILIDDDLTSLTDGDDSSVVEPLTLDAIADATRAVSSALDESDVMGEQPYVLEVSSPGTDRPLTQPRQFRRNVGRLLEISRATSADESPVPAVSGRVLRADDQQVSLAAADGAEVSVPLADITKAKVVVEFDRPSAEDDSDDASGSGEKKTGAASAAQTKTKKKHEKKGKDA
ncbi:ribosome maturation factor RimP [Dermacoccaceae bacterium W4C1]